MDEVISDQDEPAPRPGTTHVEVRQEADSVTISYGLRVSFFAQIIASVLCAIVALHALRDLGWLPAALGRASGLFDALASGTAIAGLVSRFPLVALVAATLVGAFVTLMWATRVHRVVIGRDAVRIYRGLRPLPPAVRAPVVWAHRPGRTRCACRENRFVRPAESQRIADAAVR